jgi:hypothetical protein
MARKRRPPWPSLLNAMLFNSPETAAKTNCDAKSPRKGLSYTALLANKRDTLGHKFFADGDLKQQAGYM